MREITRLSEKIPLAARDSAQLQSYGCPPAACDKRAIARCWLSLSFALTFRHWQARILRVMKFWIDAERGNLWTISASTNLSGRHFLDEMFGLQWDALALHASGKEQDLFDHLVAAVDVAAHDFEHGLL